MCNRRYRKTIFKMNGNAFWGCFRYRVDSFWVDFIVQGSKQEATNVVLLNYSRLSFSRLRGLSRITANLEEKFRSFFKR